MLNGLFKEKYALPLEEVKRRHEYDDSRYIRIQGMDVHYRDIGEGPVLILLHGMFSSLHTWEDWINILKDDFRIIALDAPNYGFTGPHPKGMFKNIYSEFLNEFTDALNIQECMLAGNSLGGWMSWEFAGRYPEKVKKVILIDSAGFFFVVPWLLMTMAFPLSPLISRTMKFPRGAFKAVLKQVYGNPDRLRKEKLNLYYDLMMREGNRSSGARVVHYIRNNIGFRTGYMKGITQPTLVMWGRKDRWIPVRHVKEFCSKIRNCRSVIYDDAGHMPMEELPEITAQDAREFLLADNNR
ncbi:alpha/beta hydrolase [Thalassolituus sp.]|mgnify:CR=1 FL=1|uniref:alpha/beta fold hydrolase n=1 Tax=Thalassolituus sp. TaxID=2030822 RepID=UPI002606751D|nr:alpha/beta hydrolase [uncultured Thalassolituus sp.]